jgi:bacteriorhodopsin
MASDLGFVPIPVEWQRGGKVSGTLRQIFYTRYIQWFITTPLLLLDLLLTAGVPWSQILFTVFMGQGMIVSRLFAALVPSTYKWGYYTMSLAFYFYIAYVLVIPARRHASAIGGEFSRICNICGLWLLLLWLLYPIAFGVSEGGNVITPDSEAAFYGVLDVFSFTGFGIVFLWSHREIDPARLGLRTRGYDELPAAYNVTEKNGHHTAPATTTA